MRALTSSRLGATDASNLNGDGGVCVCVRVFACARVHVCACVRACACVRTRVRACVRECVHDVLISILYVILIRHTDDFPSTSTRLVSKTLVFPWTDVLRGRSQLSTFMKAYTAYARGEGVWDYRTLSSRKSTFICNH